MASPTLQTSAALGHNYTLVIKGTAVQNPDTTWTFTALLDPVIDTNPVGNTNPRAAITTTNAEGGDAWVDKFTGTVSAVTTPPTTVGYNVTGNYTVLGSVLVTPGGGFPAKDFYLIRDVGNGNVFVIADFFGTSVTQAQFAANYFSGATLIANLDDNTETFACFQEGTRILTRAGYRPVEELREGDEVQTLNHGWQAIRWLGHREEQKLADGSFRITAQPIRILADAFGAGLPSRDLLVSPDHAVFFRNHLIPARHLINGVTVIRDSAVESIKYFHILLDRHAVIFSEGLPTESYVPQENLDSFDNVATCPDHLRNDIVAPIGMYTDCYPRATQGSIVETARALLSREVADKAAQLAA